MLPYLFAYLFFFHYCPIYHFCHVNEIYIQIPVNVAIFKKDPRFLPEWTLLASVFSHCLLHNHPISSWLRQPDHMASLASELNIDKRQRKQEETKAISIGIKYTWHKENKRGHDEVIKWKYFPRNWPFVRGVNRSPVNSLHKGQWRGVWMFSLICTRTNG